MITPGNVCRHELIGLKAAVERSTNPSQVGISGIVADETKNMLVIFSGDRLKAVQKKGAVFRMHLLDHMMCLFVFLTTILGFPERRSFKRL